MGICPGNVDYFKTHIEHFFICQELALDTTKKWKSESTILVIN